MKRGKYIGYFGAGLLIFLVVSSATAVPTANSIPVIEKVEELEEIRSLVYKDKLINENKKIIPIFKDILNKDLSRINITKLLWILFGVFLFSMWSKALLSRKSSFPYCFIMGSWTSHWMKYGHINGYLPTDYIEPKNPELVRLIIIIIEAIVWLTAFKMFLNVRNLRGISRRQVWIAFIYDVIIREFYIAIGHLNPDEWLT